ncbi:MAG: hypothetical protein ABI183_07045 [Polyangiaceae bacterium]
MDEGIDVSVGQAVDEYMTENGFTIAEYTAKKMTLFAGPLSFRVPNPQARQRAVPLHDIHHVVTGFGTDVIGEGEQGIWELRAGCPALVAIFLNSLAAAGAFILSPRRVIRAFSKAKGASTLYPVRGAPAGRESRISEESAKLMTVRELRRHLSVPESGIAELGERRLHSHAPQAELRAGV